jgi:hypothetical protein
VRSSSHFRTFGIWADIFHHSWRLSWCRTEASSLQLPVGSLGSILYVGFPRFGVFERITGIGGIKARKIYFGSRES